MSNNIYKVDPLNRDNYTAWQRHLEWILDDQDLWDLTNRTEMELTPIDDKVTTQEGLAIAEWKKKDKKARKEICLRISDEYLVYINQNMTAPDIWTRLQGIFKSRAAVSIINICCEFF